MSRTIVIVVIVAVVVAVSVVVVARSRKSHQQSPATPHSVTETNRMPRLDTSPPKFPE